jgi:hypothetical protein
LLLKAFFEKGLKSGLDRMDSVSARVGKLVKDGA